MAAPRKWPKFDERALAEGYSSGLEMQVMEFLRSRGCKAAYEPASIQYDVPARPARYTPDFVLENGVVVETKGRFVTADRKKHKLIKDQYPHVDIRLVFSNPNAKIGKKSKTTYAMWADHVGIPWAKGTVPQEWIDEPPHLKRIGALETATGRVFAELFS